MATTVARLEAILTANTGQFERAMTKSEGRMHSVRKTAGVAGAAIVGGLAVGLEKSVHAALDAQVSQTRLEQAFKSSGLSALRYAKQTDELEKSGRKLGFTDAQTKESLGSLLIATHSMAKASKDLSVAQDIARFKHVDLSAATKMLTMAMSGSQRATKQLGLSVQATTDQQDKAREAYKKAKEALDKQFPSVSKMTKAQQAQYYAQRDALDQQYAAAKATATLNDKQVTSAKVIDLVNQKLHGQADAYAKTAAGGLDVFRAQVEHLEVSLGTTLLPVLTSVAAALATATAYFSKHTTETKILIGATTGLGLAFLTASVYAKVMASALVTKVIPAFKGLFVATEAENAALLANPIGIVIVALAALGVALVVAYAKVAFFRNGVNAAFDWIKEHWPIMVGIMTGGLALAVAGIIKHRDSIAHAFTALPGMIGDAIGSAIGDLKDKLGKIFDWHKILKWIEDALNFHSPAPWAVGIGENIVKSIAHGVGSASGVLKDAVFGLAKKYLVSPVTSLPGEILGGGGGPSNPYRAAAKQIAAQYGWGGAQWRAYDALEMREAGYNPEARNPSSNAGGIPQALPVTKLPLAARPKWAGGGGDAVLQIRWMMNYIKGRYGDPLGAWAHEQRFGWYRSGGRVDPSNPFHVDSYSDAYWDSGARRFKLKIEGSRNNPVIPRKRMERDWFNQFQGHGPSLASTMTTIKWWEQEGFFEQRYLDRLQKMRHALGGRIFGGQAGADSVPAMLSPGEFVVTGGGERILERMTFPGVLSWLGGVQPRHFQLGGRAGGSMPSVQGGGDTVIVQVGPEEVARVVFDQLRGKARVFMRNNGRPAFGGA